MVRPCVARGFCRSGGCAVLHQCIRPLIGARRAPGHHGYQRACDLITGQTSNGPFGSPVFVRAGKTDPPSRLILSQTSAGNRCWGYVIDNSSSRTVPLFVPKAGCSFVPADVWTPKHGATLKPIGMSSHLSWRIRLALLAKDGPGDTGKLVGERDCQHVVVSRFLAASIQGLSPWRSQVFGLISTTQAACTN